MHKRRRGLWIALCLVLALGLGAAGVVLVKPDLLRAKPATFSPSPIGEPTPGPVLAALTDGALPSSSVLSTLLERLVTNSELGSTVRVSVVDLRTGAAIYERNPTTLVVPASNAKVVTAAAVLATLGAAHRITTRAVAGANPGEVVLIGSGDATLSIDGEGYYTGAGRLDDLAAQVREAWEGTPPTKLIIDGSLYQGAVLGPAWDPAAPQEGYVSTITALMINGARVDPKDKASPFERHADPELAAGQAFAKLLGISEIARGTAPAGATELGSVRSAPMIRQIETMLGESDNTLAESLARQVAVARSKPASFEGAAAALDEVLAQLGVPAGHDMVDGSGYSKLNQLSPAALTGLLAIAASDARLTDLFNVLPVAGWSGSMDYRFAKPDALAGLGVVRAKSGTLRGVNSITGVVQTVDGGLIGFAILAENVPTWQYPAQDALDRIVATIAACGCP